jgi:hypothetical protein
LESFVKLRQCRAARIDLLRRSAHRSAAAIIALRTGATVGASIAARDLVEVFELLREPDLTPRFNIALTQQVAVVR